MLMVSTLLSCIKSHKDINGDINIYPLPHLKVVKDLIGDLSNLYKQYSSIEPWLKTSKTKTEQKEILQSQKDRSNLMVIMNVYFVLVAQLLVQVIGGMGTNI